MEDEGKEVDEPYDQEIEEDEFEDEAMVLYNAMFRDAPVAKKKRARASSSTSAVDEQEADQDCRQSGRVLRRNSRYLDGI